MPIRKSAQEKLDAAEKASMRMTAKERKDSLRKHSDSYNQERSVRRANAVRDTLLGMGINSDRITTGGYEKSFPSPVTTARPVGN